MKKVKGVACGLVLMMSIGVAMPVMAADTATTAASKTNDGEAAVPTLNLTDVQKLVVSNNISNKDMQLSINLLKQQQSSVDDQRDGLTANNLEYYRQKMVEAETKGDTAEYAKWYAAYQTELGSTTVSDSTKKQLDSKYDSYTDSIKDTKKSQSDLKTDLELSAAKMYTTILTTQKQVDLVEQQLELMLKNRQIAQLRIDNGMAVEGDYQDANISTTETAATLTQLKAGLSDLKRSLNDMMGRELDAPFNLAPYDVSSNVLPAPDITTSSISKATENNYDLYTAKRTLQNLWDEYYDAEDSTTKDILYTQIQQQKLAVSKAETSIDTTLKAKADAITNNGKSFQNAQASYEKAQKDMEYAQMKYDMGMISQLELEQQNLDLLQKEYNQLSASYKYYFSRLVYEYYFNGINLTYYSQLAAM